MKKGTRKALGFAGMVLGALLAISLLWALLPIERWIMVAIASIESLGVIGIAVYLVLFAILATFSFPTTPLNVAAGVLFPYWVAVLVCMVAGGSAAVAAFLFARHVARDTFEKRLQKFPKFDAVLDAVEGEAFKMVLLARLNPFIPASVKNYGFALTEIRFRDYAAATVAGQLPIILAHVYLGWAGGYAMLSGDGPPSSLQVALLVGGLVVSVLLLVAVSWYGKRRLEAQGGGRSGP